MNCMVWKKAGQRMPEKKKNRSFTDWSKFSVRELGQFCSKPNILSPDNHESRGESISVAL